MRTYFWQIQNVFSTKHIRLNLTTMNLCNGYYDISHLVCVIPIQQGIRIIFLCLSFL